MPGLGGPGGPGGKGGMRPRPGGGFNTGMGQFGEHLDESAVSQAAAQKMLGQQQANPQGAAAAAAGAKQGAKPSAQQQPRAVGSLGDELIRRPFGDIWKEVKKFFSLNTWLGIDPNTEDPEKQQRLAAIHRGYEKLDQEQQAYARQLVQQREQQKKQQLEEDQRRKQFEQQQREQSGVQAPSSPQKGPVGPASGKSRKSNAITQMTQNRQRMGQAQGAN